MIRYLLVLILLCNVSFAQNFDIIKNKFLKFSDTAHFDLVYVHTDKDAYNTGQNIWFSAYVFNPRTNTPDTIHQILFIELIDFQKKIITLQKLFVDSNGIATGNIFLPDSFSRGYYQLRAFTNPMKNYGSQNFFTKTIYINSDNIKYSYDFFKTSKKRLKPKNKFIFHYKILNYPLVNNSYAMLYVDFLNYYSDTSSKSILLTDNHKNTYFNKNTNKPIEILFKPKINTKYFLKIKTHKSQRKIKLPEVQANKTNVLLKENKNNFTIKITRNKPRTNDKLSKSFYVLIEKSGKIFFDTTLTVDTVVTITISKTYLPQGISFIHIFNSKLHCISEMPLYRKINKSDIAFSSYFQNDTLYIKTSNPKHSKLYMSISVTNKKSDFTDIKNFMNYFAYLNYPAKKTNNILSSNQLKYITGIYFKNIYDFNSILNKKNYYTFKPLLNNYLTGFVNYLLEKVPAKDADLTLNVLNSYNDTYQTKTDKQGHFKFDKLNYDDSIEYFIQARQRNSKYLGITIDEYDTNEIFFEPLLYFSPSDISYKYTEKKKIKQRESKSMYKMHPDQIIYGDELVNSGQTNVLEALKGRVANYTKTGDLVMMRGPSSINSSLTPVYLIDDIQVDQDAVENLNIYDIDRVEIMRSAYGSAMYGMYAANGVIAVYTKQGYNIEWGETKGKFTGIAKPKKFIPIEYSDNYTYFWIPKLIIKGDKDIMLIKIPIKKQSMLQIDIQGFTDDGQFISYKNVIK